MSDTDSRMLWQPTAQQKMAQRVRDMADVNVDYKGFMRLPQYPFQRVGTTFAYMMERAIIADATGLGKSCQAIGLYALLMARNEDVGPVLFLCPGRSFYQWREECRKFLGDRPATFRDLPAARRPWVASKANFMLVNYEWFIRHHKVFDVRKDRFSLIVCDEMSSLKTHGTQTAQRVKELTKRADRVVGLTATPLETGLSDVHSLLEALNVPAVPTWPEFKQAFVKVRKMQGGGRFGRGYEYEKIIGYRNLPQAFQIVKPWVIRRTPKQVGADMPTLITRIEELEFEAPHRAAYEATRAEHKRNGSMGIAVQHDLAKLCNFATVNGRMYAPKMDYLMDLIAGDLKNQKIVVYARHIETLERIGGRLRQAGISTAVMHCGVTMETRFAIQQQFNEEDDPQVLVADDVIKDSLNLQAGRYMFIFDCPTNPARLIQLAGRIRRLTSEAGNVVLTLLLMEESHEQQLLEAAELRELLSRYMLDQDETMLSNPELSEGAILARLSG